PGARAAEYSTAAAAVAGGGTGALVGQVGLGRDREEGEHPHQQRVEHHDDEERGHDPDQGPYDRHARLTPLWAIPGLRRPPGGSSARNPEILAALTRSVNMAPCAILSCQLGAASCRHSR